MTAARRAAIALLVALAALALVTAAGVQDDGEKVVFSWMIWPDRETADASHDKMMADERMQNFSGEMPFDGKRMIVGGFDPLVVREA